MKIYFAASIVGGRESAQIVEYLLARGHEVPSAHVARPDVLDWEEKTPPSSIFAPGCRLGSGIRGHDR